MDMFLKLDANGHLFPKFYDKGVYFNFSILNVPHIDSKQVAELRKRGESTLATPDIVINSHVWGLHFTTNARTCSLYSDVSQHYPLPPPLGTKLLGSS
jgi:hypothetical protein